jgi:Recombinase/Resolvase, N terminal domain
VPRNAVAYVRPPVSASLSAEAGSLGLALVEVVVESHGQSRAELRNALGLIAGGAAGTLFLPRLEAVAGSLNELLRLLDWLEQAGAGLVAVDPELDTASAGGRRAVALMREIDRWGREPDAPRRPRGRPGLSAGSPELARELAQLRERGLSLQRIADQLNRDGIPTPRGGALWRPSSVQSALGYRRPQPPVPGAPPPKPPPGRGRPPGRPHPPPPPPRGPRTSKPPPRRKP